MFRFSNVSLPGLGASNLKQSTLLRLHFYESSLGSECEGLLGRASRKQMHGSGDDPSPSRLVTGPKPGAVVAVEVLIEQDEIAPVWVLLKLSRTAIDRPSAILIFQKDAGPPPRDLLRHLIQVHLPPRARGTFDGELIAVVGVILQQGADNQGVHRHPDRPAPVGVAPKH